jgi:hypothetical protein
VATAYEVSGIACGVCAVFASWVLASQMTKFQSSPANLNPNRARPPATTRATQLTDFGTDQSPMMTGQSSNIRIRWNRATNVKIAPATVENVLRFMGDH